MTIHIIDHVFIEEESFLIEYSMICKRLTKVFAKKTYTDAKVPKKIKCLCNKQIKVACTTHELFIKTILREKCNFYVTIDDLHHRVR